MKNIILILFCTLFFQSCDTTKGLVKNKETKKTETQTEDLTKKKSNIFSYSELDDFTITIEPLNPNIPATFTDINGKEQTTTNTKTVYSKRKEKNQTTSNNTEDTNLKKAEVVDLTTKDKTKDVERIASNSVLYIVGGIVLVLILLGALALFLLYKSINKNTALISGLVKKLDV